MLRYKKNDVSEGIDTNKTSASKNACFVFIGTLKMLDLYLNHMFETKCHDVLMTYELENITILNVRGVDFRCILWGISKDKTVNRLNNSVLEDKGGWILVQIKRLLK